jgi:hypothetical protein
LASYRSLFSSSQRVIGLANTANGMTFCAIPCPSPLTHTVFGAGRYLSFEFAHIVFLFVGINFIVEAVLLVTLIDSRNKTLLRHDNSSSEQLLIQYLELQRTSGVTKWLFDFGLVSIPVPELREKIEYKIIQEYFVRSYNLPAEFKFANYLCALLKSFVFSLIEVRPISWLVVAALAVLNYTRIHVIDPVFEAKVCEKFYTHFHHQPTEHYGTLTVVDT